MASYKVPQDVEAEDKLIGPFSFRQFVYLIAAAMLITLTWFLGTIFLPLALLPIGPALLFGALALPLRKDQPMETFLAAMVSFYLKPRRRLWDPDGTDSLVKITAPKNTEEAPAKNLSRDEAEQRLSFLAEVVDSQGWSVKKGVQVPSGSALTDNAYFEAQQAKDMFDASDSSVVQVFDQRLEEEGIKRRQALIESMQQAQSSSEPAVAETEPKLSINPYPADMQQSVIDPISNPNSAPKAGIIDLANANDKTDGVNLSVDSLSKLGNRINQQDYLSEGASISLR